MSKRQETTLPATRPRSRKSLSAFPSGESGGVMDKENMTTEIGGLGSHKRDPLGERPVKKTRSKSLGPGGLDALKDGAGNRGQTLAIPPPRSILKPTLPPLREIPARKTSPRRSAKAAETIQPPPATSQKSSPDTTDGGDSLPNPFMLAPKPAIPETKVMLRNEEEQHNAARAREEKEKATTAQDLKARREARRKSLANRRVSFAPEATLHTWDVVEYMQDSTTSSSATNSTRRESAASSAALQSPQPDEIFEALNSPSTPTGQLDDDSTVGESPESQRSLHQKKRRRSSGIPPLNFNNPDDEFMSSSPFSGDSETDGEEVEDAFDDAVDDSDSNEGSDDEGTVMSLDGGDTTNMTMASEKSNASITESSAILEEALRLASRQAGTHRADYETEEVAEDEDIVASFAPWSQRSEVHNVGVTQDKENLNPFSPAFKAVVSNATPDSDDDEEIDVDMEITRAVGGIIPEEQSDEEMTMDMTLAVGGIILDKPTSTNGTRRKSVAGRRQSTRRRSSGGGSSYGDETMDLTMAIGSIQPKSSQLNKPELDNGDFGEDEDMSMEFTSVIGGMLASGRRVSTGQHSSRENVDDQEDDAAMEMTVAIGKIHGEQNRRQESNTDDDMTAAMDMTMAVGKILPTDAQVDARMKAKLMMEEEVDSPGPVRSPVKSSGLTVSEQSAATIASESGSPSHDSFKGKGLRRSVGRDVLKAPQPNDQHVSPGTPVKTPSTPSRQMTPKPNRPTTPGKTPPSKNIAMRITSPKHLFTAELNASIRTPKSATKKTPTPKKTSTPNKLFHKDVKTGNATPSIILIPKKRRSSGFGIDKQGLGSPKIAAILDRRGSIADDSVSFSPGQFRLAATSVRFEDPREIAAEVDKDREELESRENGRKIMEREADISDDEKDATVNLKEMIQSLTPKKRPLKGRKSLHVGAAKGVLGKRPAELDEADDDDSDSGLKRLRNHQGSPVKNIKLQAPPSKEETTGRITRSLQSHIEATVGRVATPNVESSPKRSAVATTPKGQERFKEIDMQDSPQNLSPFVERLPLDDSEAADDEQMDEPMPLQDFLNMTSIRFMELTTTKRRHTIAPKFDESADLRDANNDMSLETCTVACACTVPMLELFQHSCRELKKYISEGRKVIREIEAETYEINPPLFREYISATPDVKTLMDTQFKNVKANARLTSKGMWYEWRMKLLEGLKEGLAKIAEGMTDDGEVLQQQLELLDSVLPELIKQFESVEHEEAQLQEAARKLADCDQEALTQSRERLVVLDEDVKVKRNLIKQLQAELQEKEAQILEASNRKQSCMDDIRAAEKVREECRGWTGNEVLSLKAKVDALEQAHGWTVTGVQQGTSVSMSYKSDLELVFDVSAFRHNKADADEEPKANSTLDLWYIGDSRERDASPLTMEKKFFLENIRDHCRARPQSQTSVSELLQTVSAAWTKALILNDQIQVIRLEMPTETSKTSDNSILVKSMMLLTPIATKVQFCFDLVASSTAESFEIDVTPRASVVYGNGFNEDKMTEFVIKRLNDEDGQSRRGWASALLELEGKLMARMKK